MTQPGPDPQPDAPPGLGGSAAEPPGSRSADPTPARAGSFRADVVSGYVLTACRVAAWAGVSALVFRHLGEGPFAVLALLRGTITLVGYTSLGLGPAMVRLLAEAGRTLPLANPRGDRPVLPGPVPEPWAPAAGPAESPAGPAPVARAVLDYATPAPAAVVWPERTWSPEQQVYAVGARLARWAFGFAVLLTVGYAALLTDLHVVPVLLRKDAAELVLLLGVGVAVRLLSEPMSAALQARGHLAVDNVVLGIGELAWLGLTAADAAAAGAGDDAFGLVDVGRWWFAAAFLVAAGRAFAKRAFAPELVDVPRAGTSFLVGRLLGFGLMLGVASVADFLYAPTDYILINRLLSPLDVADYAPAVQVDAALLLAVAGLAAAVFPRVAAAHAAGDTAAVRRLYVRGTLAGAAVLLAAAGAVLALSDRLFALWLGHDLPATRAILPLVLVHTVVGGSGAVGRAVLLGMGRVRAFTVSVLVAGAANVVLSATFAAGLGMGLRGIVLGTIVVVVARAGVWTPWYVLRALRQEAARRPADEPRP